MATKVAHIREATILQGLGAPTSDQFYRLAKRVFDIALSTILLIVLLPLMLLVALAVALDSTGPVIFRQKRVLGDQSLDDGQPEQNVFEFYKFRTMFQHADQSVHKRHMEKLIEGGADPASERGKGLYKLDKDPRITRVGRILRKTSLDELPQLVNIFRGEMSFVGPRPAIPYEVSQYKAWHGYRLTITQGLTGLWQVMGRTELSFDEMVQLDIEYARRRSLLFDLKIVLATLPAVLSGRGAR